MDIAWKYVPFSILNTYISIWLIFIYSLIFLFYRLGWALLLQSLNVKQNLHWEKKNFDNFYQN